MNKEKTVIDRYCTKQMSEIWDRLPQLKLWALVETMVLRARFKLGLLDVTVPEGLPDSLAIDPEEVDRIEDSGVGHEVVAFLMHTSPQLPSELRPWWHHKLTSYDICDTATMLQLRRSIDELRAALFKLTKAIRQRAFEHKYTGMIGRTHGIHAEPITFGVKLANWYDECSRHAERLNQLRNRVSAGKISGVVGMYTLPPSVEEETCHMLRLNPIVATQIIARDIIAEYGQFLALIGGTVAKIGIQIRRLASTEIREVQEYFDPDEHASSAMPHKRNPKSAENVCSLARVLRGYQVSLCENQETWDERSLDNSACERIVLPDASHLAHYMLLRLAKNIETLIVYPARMKQNLELTRGLIFSQDVQALIAEESRLPREEAYKLVRAIAQRCWDSGEDFREAVLSKFEILEHVSRGQIDNCFNVQNKTQYVHHIFERVFGRKEGR
ncbi:adenylosuccinate lyase [Candidatus Uhrbacteria bacterium]|nr:adenylosuccinate lyase [Candidatus Uhrbacteria bacterium]